MKYKRFWHNFNAPLNVDIAIMCSKQKRKKIKEKGEKEEDNTIEMNLAKKH